MQSEKQKSTALLLCFFLGAFGAHRFYVGKTGTAIAQLIMSLTLILIFVTAIWAFVDFIMIICDKFTDSKGLIIK